MAGFVKFDPDKWDHPNGAEGVAKVAKPAKAEPSLATLASLAGVRSLDPKRPPRGARPEAWALSVRDAKRLLEDGWAEQAASLGWTPLDLFGGCLDPGGDSQCDGLAVWLQGRRVVALSDKLAIARSRNGSRSYFSLPRAPGARLLWALGGGR